MWQATVPIPADGTAPAPLPSIPFDTIEAPGTYVCNWNGYLLRVPEGALGPGNRRVFNLVGTEPLFVTKISDDPGLSVGRARQIAGDHALTANF